MSRRGLDAMPSFARATRGIQSSPERRAVAAASLYSLRKQDKERGGAGKKIGRISSKLNIFCRLGKMAHSHR